MITLAEILRLNLRDEQLGEDVDLHNIASKTDYYSGSDLKGEFVFSVSTVSPINLFCVSSLRVSCNGIRQRFRRQL
jgi:hypothetical protein